MLRASKMLAEKWVTRDGAGGDGNTVSVEIQVVSLTFYPLRLNPKTLPFYSSTATHIRCCIKYNIIEG